MDDAKLIISRYWHNPIITVVVNSEQIQVQMPVEDFLKAMVSEIPHPSITMTRAQLEKQMLSVLNDVLNKAKKATAEV